MAISETLDITMVQMAGIEPARFIQPQDFKSCASTSSATSAYLWLTKIIVLQTKYICQVYFTHPYASYERGCNENKNRMIRRYFKKGKLVEALRDEDILNIARKINNMPRKALGYKTPLEVFESNLKKKGIDTSFLDAYRIELPKCLVA